MEKYLSIVEEHANVGDIDKIKLKQFLAQTKVWEYARITEQDYKNMSDIDRFALLQDYYSYMNKVKGQIDLDTANRINQASVITSTEQGVGSNQHLLLKVKTKMRLKLTGNLFGRNLDISVSYVLIITSKKLIFQKMFFCILIRHI